MKGLTKSQIKDRDERYKLVCTEHEKLEAAIAAANEKAALLHEDFMDAQRAYAEAVNNVLETLDEPLSDYTEALRELQTFAEEIATEIEATIDERSENWQNGERGAEYVAWKDEWAEYAQLDTDPELPSAPWITEPEKLEIDVPDLPEDPSGLQEGI